MSSRVCSFLTNFALNKYFQDRKQQNSMIQSDPISNYESICRVSISKCWTKISNIEMSVEERDLIEKKSGEGEERESKNAEKEIGRWTRGAFVRDTKTETKTHFFSSFSFSFFFSFFCKTFNFNFLFNGLRNILCF